MLPCVGVDLVIQSATPRGKPTTMPAKINSDMPLPTPRSVICSPSHMMNALPVVRVSHGHQDEGDAGVDDEIAGLFQADAMPSD